MNDFRGFVVRIPTVLALVDPLVTYVGDEEMQIDRQPSSKKNKKRRILRICLRGFENTRPSRGVG